MFKLLAVVLACTMSEGKLDGIVLPPDCDAPLDVVQLQDMTSSFDSLWAGMSTQIGDIIDMVYSSSSNANFGFSTFGDKPMHPFGFGSDYVAKIDIPLGKPKNEDMVKLFNSYTKKAAGGGGDWPEASMEALMRVLESPTMGWREGAHKILVLVTDALPHMHGDVGAENIKVREFDLTPKQLSKVNVDSKKVEYPTFEQVAEMVGETGVRLVIVASPAGVYQDGKFLCWDNIWQWGTKYGNEDGLALWYQDRFLEENTKISVTPVDQQMNGYANAFQTGFKMAMKSLCPQLESTTETPTTTTTGSAPRVESTVGSTGVAPNMSTTPAPRIMTTTAVPRIMTTTPVPRIMTTTTVPHIETTAAPTGAAPITTTVPAPRITTTAPAPRIETTIASTPDPTNQAASPTPIRTTVPTGAPITTVAPDVVTTTTTSTSTTAAADVVTTTTTSTTATTTTNIIAQSTVPINGDSTDEITEGCCPDNCHKDDDCCCGKCREGSRIIVVVEQEIGCGGDDDCGGN